jgi:AcrR family transcriptional regulator
MRKPFDPGLSLSAEVGKYFLPDGHFDESVFRKSLKKRIAHFKASETNPHQNSPDAGPSMSEYLRQIVAYVLEKGMPDAAVQLFKAAIDEAARSGMPDINVSPEFLNLIMLRYMHDDTPKKEEKPAGKDDMRQKIFHAALHIIGEKGYHTATMDEIASESGVAKGSLYRYFKSKEDLMEQLLIDKYKMISDQCIRLFSEGDDILLQIQHAIEFYMQFIEQNPIAYRLIQNEASNPQRENSITFYDHMARHLPMLKERVVALNLEQRLKTTDFYTVFYGILGFMDGVAQKWFISGMSYPLKDEIPLVLEVLFNGFVGENTTRTYFYQ